MVLSTVEKRDHYEDRWICQLQTLLPSSINKDGCSRVRHCDVQKLQGQPMIASIIMNETGTQEHQFLASSDTG